MDTDIPFGMMLVDDAVENCDSIVQWCEQQDTWRKSTVGDGQTSETRTSDTLFIPFLSYGLPEFIQNMNSIVWKHMDSYARQFSFQFSEVETVSIQRYSAAQAQHYKTHIDAAPDKHRILSALLYLNTVESGGHTVFPLSNLAIQPKAGRLVLFPSNYLFPHSAEPPLVGTKWAVAYWAVA